MDILSLGLAGIVSYGFVGVLAYILNKRWNITMEPDIKFFVLVVVALLVGFIPADLGTLLLNHLKEALAIAFALSTMSTVANKAGGK